MRLSVTVVGTIMLLTAGPGTGSAMTLQSAPLDTAALTMTLVGHRDWHGGSDEWDGDRNWERDWDRSQRYRREWRRHRHHRGYHTRARCHTEWETIWTYYGPQVVPVTVCDRRHQRRGW
jgi:hypothetical protein